MDNVPTAIDLISAGWQPLNSDRPYGDHKYYLLTHLGKRGEWTRPEVQKWKNVDFYREKYASHHPMIKPIEMKI